MPHIWQTTVDEFIGNYPVTELTEEQDKAFADHIDWVTMAWIPSTLKPLWNSEEFFLCDIHESDKDTALIKRTRDGKFHDVVGGYCDSVLWVADSLRGRGFAVELILETAAKRNCEMDPISYTREGLEAHKKAHREGVRRAWSQGCDIPLRVLLDGHQDLMAENTMPLNSAPDLNNSMAAMH